MRSGYVNQKLQKFNEEAKGQRVAIIGLGKSNIPLVDYFKNLNCKIDVYDNRNFEDLSDDLADKLTDIDNFYSGPAELKHLNDEIKEDRIYIFRSPSCLPTNKYLAKAYENPKAIVKSEIEWVVELSPSHIIGITGSDGKTTTSTLIYEFLKEQGKKCFLGGNIGNPLFTQIKDMRKNDFVVLELSSFQLMSFRKSPQIAVITNISPNHLNVHKDYEEYIDSKKNIFKYQRKTGLLVTNKDNEITKTFNKEAKGKFLYFTHKEKDLRNGVIFNEDTKNIEIHDNGKIIIVINQKDILLRGEHNAENIAAAIAATKEYVDIETYRIVLKRFKGVEHRLEFVRKLDGVKWFNDSIGTSPTRTIAGLNSFDERIVLIAGGYDKHLDYTPIAKPIIKNVSKLILMGATADKIEEAVTNEMKKEKIDSSMLPIYREKTLKDVVKKAREVAKNGEIVLFSPASASFDLFKDFEDRGNKFKAEVKSLK